MWWKSLNVEGRDDWIKDNEGKPETETDDVKLGNVVQATTKQQW